MVARLAFREAADVFIEPGDFAQVRLLGRTLRLACGASLLETTGPHSSADIQSMKIQNLILASCAFALLPVLHAAPPEKLELKKGDHVSILGNELADRMQHTGWLETLIEKKFAADQVAFRNLAAAGDEVATWHRSQDFGSRNEWLTWTQADVVFAFYGFNESFKGEAGVGKFKSDLDGFLKEMAKQNFGGKGAPRVVLFSPIANERHQDADFADPAATNANLKLYTAAMAEVAKANEVQFIDLFNPSQDLFKEAAAKKESLTLDGMHLTEAGEKALAPLAYRALFGESAPEGDLAKLHEAVLDKSWEWHQRYRTIDGYNVFGGRSREKYAPRAKDGKTSEPIFNNAVMQREMQMRDVMTANRDQRVWAVAQGGDLVVKDDNLPAPVPVQTNKPGDKEDASWTYPDAQEAIAKMKVNENCKVNLFADEKQFPELANPVQMSWDTKGRLWVAAWKNYPEREPTSKDGDKLLIFEDTNGDGKADKCTTFLDDLNGPTGFSFYKDGVLVMQAPDLWYVPIGKDGKAGKKERMLMGMDSADSHHTTNALNPDPAGAIYPSDGVFHRTQVETANGPLRHSDAIAWRFEPRTMKMEKYAPYGLVNPHGKVWDYWGDDILTNATSNGNYFGPAISGHLDNGDHPGIKDFWNRPSRPCPGTWMISSGHFPDDWQGNFLNCNVISDQCIYRVKVSQDGAGLKGETIEKLVYADPAELPMFRPICVDIGPDGAIYFCDWSQTIIGHLQHHLRDPNRDHQHGRIYRITYNGRALLTPPKIDGEPIPALLEVLKSHEDNTRTLAKTELGKRNSAEVVAAVKQWAAALDKSDPMFEHNRLEALWVCQWFNAVDADLLKQVLASPEPRARAAAVRVLCYQRDRVPDALALLKQAAADADPRVRLQAVRAASFFGGKDVPAAFEVAYASLKHENDYYLDYVYKETIRQLQTLASEPVLPADPEILSTMIEKMSDGDLAKAPSIEPVLLARLERASTDFSGRNEIINRLVKLHESNRVLELVGGLQRLDDSNARGGAADDLGKLLAATPAGDLTKSRAAIAGLADGAKQPPVRRAAWAAMIIADANPQTTWSETKSDTARENLVDSIAFLPDPALRAKFQPLLNAALGDARTSGNTRSAALRVLPLMGAENARGNFVTLAAHLARGLERTAAARAIVQLPREAWVPQVSAPAVESVVAWAKTIPDGDRTKQDFIETVQAGSELAGLLPPADAARLRKELRGLGVSVFVVKTVREQMRYDTTRLVVEAGKPIEIIIENTDAMPHNFVVVQPASRQEVAEAAQNMKPDALDSQGRAFIPKDHPKIIAGSKLVEPGHKETLKLKVPDTEGEYEYVCTFPGHWTLMWGKLVVTKDVDAYLQAHPVADAIPPSAPVDHSQHQHGELPK